MPFCDLQCRHARWPEAEGLDGSGSCRTFLALFCEKRRRLVHKNAPCADKEPFPEESPAPRKGRKKAAQSKKIK
jgi:hypothetical protein